MSPNKRPLCPPLVHTSFLQLCHCCALLFRRSRSSRLTAFSTSAHAASSKPTACPGVRLYRCRSWITDSHEPDRRATGAEGEQIFLTKFLHCFSWLPVRLPVAACLRLKASNSLSLLRPQTLANSLCSMAPLAAAARRGTAGLATTVALVALPWCLPSTASHVPQSSNSSARTTFPYRSAMSATPLRTGPLCFPSASASTGARAQPIGLSRGNALGSRSMLMSGAPCFSHKIIFTARCGLAATVKSASVLHSRSSVITTIFRMALAMGFIHNQRIHTL